MSINSLNTKLANGGGDRGLLDIRIVLCVSITVIYSVLQKQLIF